MDQITKLYKNKAEMLTEQVAFLEAQLKYLNEWQAPLMVFSGTGKGQKYFSDEELRDQVRHFKRTGLFGAEVPLEKQQQEYKDAVAELERRSKSQEEAKAKSTTTTKPSAAKSGGVSAPGGGVGKTEQTAPTTKTKTTVPPQRPTVPTGVAQSGQPIQKPEQKNNTGTPAQSTGTEGTQQISSPKDSGVSPNLLVPGIVAAGLYGAQKAIEQAQRVREPFKPAKPKPTEVKTPAQDSAQAKTKTPKGPAEVKPSTIGGKPVGEGKPSVAEKAAMGRDYLRAKMDAARAAEQAAKGTAEVKPNVPETQVKPGDISTKGGQVVSKSPQVSSKVEKLIKGSAKTAGSIGAALGGEMAVEKGLEALGVENEHIKGVVAPTVGWAAGEGALATALGLARSVGMGAALAAGGAAAWPAAIFGALAYPSYKAAEASQAAMEKEAERIKKAGSATKARFIGPKY